MRAAARAARFPIPAALLALLVSCARAPQGPASLPAPPAAAPKPAATTPAVPATPKPVAASPAAPDTVPSPAAVAVLASIPEPLGEAPRGKKGKDAPATPAPKPVSIPAPAEMADSLQAGEVSPPTDAPAKPAVPSNASDTSSIPVPAPTRALGQDAPALPPTPAAPPAAATPVAEPPATPAQPAAEPIEGAAAADTCWRVQVGAPSVRAKAARLRSAAESQLLMRMVVEHERGLWKVRTQDCVNRTTAESLKARALASGFQGVFLVRYIKRP